MTNTDPTVPPTERIQSLDVLRGIAIFGILLINVPSIGLPTIASINPSGYGSFTGIEYGTWLFFHIFADQKFLTIFTVLFGAGILLFTDKKAGTHSSPSRLHHRRMFWLLIIGLIHAYLIWDGDILTIYAVCGFGVVAARKWEPINQLITGVGLVLFSSLHDISFAVQGETSVISAWEPDAQQISSEITMYQSDWVTQVMYRAPDVFSTHTVGFLSGTGWQVAGLMLMGMAAYRYGILSGDRSDAFYTKLAAITLFTGIIATSTGVVVIEYTGWDKAMAIYWNELDQWGSIITGFGYIAVIVKLTNKYSNVVTQTFAEIGRTALSNYILQSLIATTIFYGHGAGLIGSLTRSELVIIICFIWMVQIILTRAWLTRYSRGPLEQLWRNLTYRGQ